MTRLLVPLFTAILVASCGGLMPSPALPPTPRPAECLVDLTPCTKYALDLLETAADLGLQAQNRFLAAEQLGAVPSHVAPKIHVAFRQFSQLGLAALAKVRTAQSFAELQAFINPVIEAARILRSQAVSVTATQPNDWRQLVAALVPIAIDALTQGGR